MKWTWRKGLAAGVAVTAFYWLYSNNAKIGRFITTHFPIANQSVQEEFKSSLEETIAKCESAGFPISKKPYIMFDLFEHPESNGMYIAAEDTMYLNTHRLTTSEITLSNALTSVLNLGNTSNVQELLGDIVATIYLDQLREQKKLPKPYEDLPQGMWVRFGLGSYFQSLFDGTSTYIDPSYLPSDPNKIQTPEEIGAHAFIFIKPILDEFGERGLLYVAMNPPKNSLPQDVRPYWRQARNALSQ